MNHPTRKTRSRRTGPKRPKALRITVALIVITVVMIVLVEWILPAIILNSVNRKMSRNPGYRNHIGGLEINILRGGYALEDFKIRRIMGDTVRPVFTAKKIDVSFQWTGLFRGRMMGEIFLDEPALYIIKPFPVRKKPPPPLSVIIKRFYPFPLDGMEIRNGTLHFQDYTEKTPVDVYLSEMNGVSRGLANIHDPDARDAKDSTKAADRRASAKVEARVMGVTPTHLEVSMIPGAPYPDIEMKADLEDFPLTSLNGLFRAYAGLDVESGTVGFTTRITARDGRFHGVLHPRLRNLEILNAEKDKGIVQKAWEALAETAGKLLEKESRTVSEGERPLSGSFTRKGQDEWKAMGALMTGAFVHSLAPRLGKVFPPQEGIRWDPVESSE